MCVQFSQFIVGGKITSDWGQIGERFNKINKQIPTNCYVWPTYYVEDFNLHAVYVAHVETSGICTIIYGMKEFDGTVSMRR